MPTSGIQIGGFYGFALMPATPLLRRRAVPILAAGPTANFAIALAIWATLGVPEVGGRLELDVFDPRGPGAAGYLKPLSRAGA